MQETAAHSQSGCVKARLGERVPQVHPKQLQIGLIQAGELQVGPLARTGLLVQRLQVVRLIAMRWAKVQCRFRRQRVALGPHLPGHTD